jgi:hypothetical protein
VRWIEWLVRLSSVKPSSVKDINGRRGSCDHDHEEPLDFPNGYGHNGQNSIQRASVLRGPLLYADFISNLGMMKYRILPSHTIHIF